MIFWDGRDWPPNEMIFFLSLWWRHFRMSCRGFAFGHFFSFSAENFATFTSTRRRWKISRKTHFHSFPHRFVCSWGEIGEENCKNMFSWGGCWGGPDGGGWEWGWEWMVGEMWASSEKHFNPEKLPLHIFFYYFSRSLLSRLLACVPLPLHHEILLSVRRTGWVAGASRGVFLVSCLVKARARSALNWNSIFPKVFPETLRTVAGCVVLSGKLRSLLLVTGVLRRWFFLLRCCCCWLLLPLRRVFFFFLFHRVCGLRCESERRRRSQKENFSFRLRENLYGCVISVPAVSIRISFLSLSTPLKPRRRYFSATFIKTSNPDEAASSIKRFTLFLPSACLLAYRKSLREAQKKLCRTLSRSSHNSNWILFF